MHVLLLVGRYRRPSVGRPERPGGSNPVVAGPSLRSPPPPGSSRARLIPFNSSGRRCPAAAGAQVGVDEVGAAAGRSLLAPSRSCHNGWDHGNSAIRSAVESGPIDTTTCCSVRQRRAERWIFLDQMPRLRCELMARRLGRGRNVSCPKCMERLHHPPTQPTDAASVLDPEEGGRPGLSNRGRAETRTTAAAHCNRRSFRLPVSFLPNEMASRSSRNEYRRLAGPSSLCC